MSETKYEGTRGDYADNLWANSGFVTIKEGEQVEDEIDRSDTSVLRPKKKQYVISSTQSVDSQLYSEQSDLLTYFVEVRNNEEAELIPISPTNTISIEYS